MHHLLFLANLSMSKKMKSIFLLVDSVINIYIWLIIINAVLSWLVAFNVLNTQNRFVFSVLNATHQLTDPVLNKIRRFIPNLGSIDISPVVLILLLIFIRNLFFELLAPSLFNLKYDINRWKKNSSRFKR